jgi:hypothetical protein
MRHLSAPVTDERGTPVAGAYVGLLRFAESARQIECAVERKFVRASA